MELANTIAVGVNLAAASGAIVFTVFMLRQPATHGRFSLAFYGLSTMLAFTASLFFSTGWASPLLGLGLTWLGYMLSAVALFAFAVHYTRKEYLRKLFALIGVFALPLLFFVVLFFLPVSAISRSPVTGINGTLILDGQWAMMSYFYINIMLTLAAVLLIRTFFGTLPFRSSAWAVFLAVLLPIPFLFVGFAGVPIVVQLVTVNVMYLISLAFLYYAFVVRKLLLLVPLPRELAVEKMADGWVVVDMNNHILDLNAVAEDVVGSRMSAYGKDFSTIMTDWNIVASEISNNVQMQVNVRTGPQDDPQYLDLRAFLITDRNGNPLGRLLSWYDVTEKRLQEEGRARAHDQMFSLMYSISSAAGRTKSMDEFVQASTQQVTHAFRCQASFVLLANDFAARDADDGLLMASSYNIPYQSEKRFSMMSYVDPLVSPVVEKHEPYYIPDLSRDVHIPSGIRENLTGGMLLVPMMAEGNFAGVLGLVRPSEMPFSPDEIENIRSLADQMAGFVSGDRRRQLAMVMAERQRLMRDLHDSVTQKLYGLLALTEAAEMGLEAGSTEMLSRSLPRITENARQALKEMRLFLFELQPRDLERDGLESVLHQRLASVEGRADIQTSLSFGEKITLSLEKELALYYIAMEALNNVLKHARAKNVTVKVHQGRMNVFMEIEDDGVGFNPSLEKTGSMGLRNMRYRVEQVGGRIKINSAPNKGTQVIVTVGRDPATRLA